jgi:hypothetical protein
VFAVPRSMAKSLENKPSMGSNNITVSFQKHCGFSFT